MTVRVFNHSPFLVFTQRGKPIPSQGYVDVEPLDVQRLIAKNIVRMIADNDEEIVPLISPQEAAELIASGVEIDDEPLEEHVSEKETEVVPEIEPIRVVSKPAFSQKGDGSSTIKPKRARTKRPPAAKE